MSFVFWDTETTGISTDFDQILQFAAVHVDEELREVDRFDIRCRLGRHVVPHPGALVVTGVGVDRLLDPSLPNHYDMIRSIRAKLLEWSPSIFVGYNSMRFDEQLLRQALFRTLHPAYLTNTGGNCRADALALVQAASVFVPGCLEIPVGDKGRPLFKLDRVAPLNGFDHANAHDALADVEATIHLARCVRANASAVWDRFVRFSSKAAVAQFLENESAALLTEFQFNRPYQYVVSTFAVDPANPAALLALNLNTDLEWIAGLPDDQLATWVARSPMPVRRVKTNSAPCLTPLGDVPPGMLAPLDARLAMERANSLREDENLKQRLIAAVVANLPEYEESPYVEEQLYGRFSSNADQVRMARFHEQPWDHRSRLVEEFEDARLRYYGRRLVYEHDPALLDEVIRREVEDQHWERLLARPAPKGKWTTLDTAIEAAAELMADCTERDLAILVGFRDFVERQLDIGQHRAVNRQGDAQ